MVVDTVGHVGINVTDLDRSVEFYGKVFGLEVLSRGDHEGSRFGFLGGDGRIVLTLWEQASSAFDGFRAGLHHLAFQVADMKDVELVASRLEGLDAKVLHGGPVAHREGSASGGVFFEDPDGTRLEVFAGTGAERLSAPSGTGSTCGFF